MKKQILFACFFAMATASAFSQVSFCHSIGGSLYINSETAGFAILYSPRLNLAELNDESTISIGTHFGFGLSGSVNSQDGGSGTVTVDAPLMVEYNYGLAANPDEDDDFGFFGGVGFGYNLMGGTDDTFGGTYGGSSAGPVLNAGVRVMIAEHPLGARLSYLINVKNNGASTVGIGLFYILGDY